MWTGLDALDRSTLESVSRLFPAPRYEALLLESRLKLVAPRSNDDYFTHEQADLWELDRPPSEPPTDPGTTTAERVCCSGTAPARDDDKGQLFEFVVPLVPPERMVFALHDGASTDEQMESLVAALPSLR